LRLGSRQQQLQYWRPQILLLVKDPWAQMRLIDFINSLKKGGLYVLGNVIVGDFAPQVRHARGWWA
jgi:potassium/chloride transporter 9